MLFFPKTWVNENNYIDLIITTAKLLNYELITTKQESDGTKILYLFSGLKLKSIDIYVYPDHDIKALIVDNKKNKNWSIKTNKKNYIETLKKVYRFI